MELALEGERCLGRTGWAGLAGKTWSKWAEALSLQHYLLATLFDLVLANLTLFITSRISFQELSFLPSFNASYKSITSVKPPSDCKFPDTSEVLPHACSISSLP